MAAVGSEATACLGVSMRKTLQTSRLSTALSAMALVIVAAAMGAPALLSPTMTDGVVVAEMPSRAR